MTLTDMQRGVRRRGTADRDDHPTAGGHLADRAVKASCPRRIAMRGIVAAVLAGLVLYGFVPNADGNCPATLPAGSTPVSTFTTMGLGDSTAPTGTPLTTSVTAAGFVGWNSFEDANLTPTAYGEAGVVSSGYRAFMPGFSQFIIAETGPRIAGRFPLGFGAQGRFGPWKTSDDPNSAQWSLVDVTCLNGVGERVNVTRDADTGGVDCSQVAPASSPAALPITCTFTNREQVPKLRIQKELDSVEGATTDDITVTYRITATNDGALAGTTGRLTDTPNFAPGLTVRSAAVAIYDNEALAGDPVSVLDGGSSFVTAPLETGKTCWFVETRAPAGHALLPRPVAFHIEAGTDADATTVVKTDFGADEGSSSVRVLPASGSLPGDRTPGIRVVDTQVGVLPKAGSSGVYPQLAGGAAMLGLAGACAWRRRERTQAA